MGTIREGARSYNVSLFEAAETLLKNQELPTRTQKALTDFFIIIDILKNHAVTDNHSLSELIRIISLKSGLIEHFKKEKGGRGLDRIENINELTVAAKDFDGDQENGILESFFNSGIFRVRRNSSKRGCGLRTVNDTSFC